jgi:hypothetical protein
MRIGTRSRSAREVCFEVGVAELRRDRIDRVADQVVRRLAEEARRVRIDVGDAPVAIDRVVALVDAGQHGAQPLVDMPESRTGLLDVIDLGRRPEPFDNIAFRIAHRAGSPEKPTVASVASAKAHLVQPQIRRRCRAHQGIDDPALVLGVHGVEPAQPQRGSRRDPRIFIEALVHILASAIRVGDEQNARHGVGHEAEALLVGGGAGARGTVDARRDKNRETHDGHQEKAAAGQGECPLHRRLELRRGQVDGGAPAGGEGFCEERRHVLPAAAIVAAFLARSCRRPAQNHPVGAIADDAAPSGGQLNRVEAPHQALRRHHQRDNGGQIATAENRDADADAPRIVQGGGGKIDALAAAALRDLAKKAVDRGARRRQRRAIRVQRAEFLGAVAAEQDDPGARRLRHLDRSRVKPRRIVPGQLRPRRQARDQRLGGGEFPIERPHRSARQALRLLLDPGAPGRCLIEQQESNGNEQEEGPGRGRKEPAASRHGSAAAVRPGAADQVASQAGFGTHKRDPHFRRTETQMSRGPKDLTPRHRAASTSLDMSSAAHQPFLRKGLIESPL